MLLLVLQGATVVVRAGGTEGLAVPDLPSTSTFAARLGEGGTDMTSAIPLRQHTTAAERMRLSHLRRRDGMRVVPFEVRDAEIEGSVRAVTGCVARNIRVGGSLPVRSSMQICCLTFGKIAFTHCAAGEFTGEKP
jgi:hypothetical protein